MTNNEKMVMKSFKVEELEERLEMKLWDGHSDGKCGDTREFCEDTANHE